MVRVICTNERLASYGLFGTVVGHVQPSASRFPVRAGILYNVVWLDFDGEGSDEIDGGNLNVVSETTFQIEVLERKIDGCHGLD